MKPPGPFPRLAPGDRVRVVAPAGPCDLEALEAGLQVLRALGLEVVEGEHLRARAGGFLAGPDAQRAADLTEALGDADCRGVFYARGGYGTTRLLNRLDLPALRRSRSLLVGYSDATALALALCGDTPFPFLHGPTVSELGRTGPPHDPESFRANLFGRHPAGGPIFEGLDVVQDGEGEGTAVGGCLSLVTSLLGTPFLPDLDGCILFLEEVCEEPYRIDRMLTQLRDAGVLGRLAGLLLGQLTECVPRRARRGDLTAEQVVASFAGEVSGPVLGGVPAGHGPRHHSIPLGCRVRLTGGRALFYPGG